MRLHRFYISQPLGEEVVIRDVSKIRQWAKVFRYRKDDTVMLFNGEGFDIEYSIFSISSKECTLRRKDTFPSHIEKKKITLYLSLIKKDAFELAMQKATELGVSAVVPIISDRSLEKNLNFDRLRSIAIEASEQSGRGNVPAILETAPLSRALSDSRKDTVSIIFQKNSPPLKNLLQNLHPKPTSLAIFIGPEGGWSDDELEIFSKESIISASLGETTLRAETAAIVALSSVMQGL